MSLVDLEKVEDFFREYTYKTKWVLFDKDQWEDWKKDQLGEKDGKQHKLDL